VNLRSGQGEILVPAEAPFDPEDCFKLGMRVDPRTNYLFVAGCIYSNAYVFDAATGDLIMEYELTPDLRSSTTWPSPRLPSTSPIPSNLFSTGCHFPGIADFRLIRAVSPRSL
jgi:hypothetical protein